MNINPVWRRLYRRINDSIRNRAFGRVFWDVGGYVWLRVCERVGNRVLDHVESRALEEINR
jgi:hypothetical protein